MKRCLLVLSTLLCVMMLFTSCTNSDDKGSTYTQYSADCPYIVVDYVEDEYGNIVQRMIYNIETKTAYVYNYFYEYVNGFYIVSHIDTIVMEDNESPYIAE